MIVSCPKCRKQYRLDVTRLIYSRLPDNSGLGVQLACSNCQEQWWEVKKEQTNNSHQINVKAAVPDYIFKNLTDLSLLYNNRSYARSSYNQPSSTPLPKINVFSPGTSKLTVPVEKKIKESTSDDYSSYNWQEIAKVALVSLLLFSGIVALALFSLGYNLLEVNNLPPTTLVEMPSPANAELTIEDVKFSTSFVTNNQQRILVIGTVNNSTPVSIQLKDLEIVALGTCLADEKPNDQGVCQLRTWNYKWKQDLLNPGEKLTFKSAAKVSSNVSVSQVYVDIPNNK